MQEMKSYWLSSFLLVLAYATFGRWLYGDEVMAVIWWSTLGFVTILAAVLTLIWRPVRKFVLLGFQSDVGYAIMVLGLASLAVLAVVQFRAFAYGVVLVTTSILVKVDCLVQNLSDRRSFLVLVLLPALGLGLSWLPYLFRRYLFHPEGVLLTGATLLG